MSLMGWFRPGLSPKLVGYDMHNHLLPGVDDGVRDSDEALGCIKLLQSLGYRGTVITPHIFKDVFDNSEAFLRERFEEFRKLAAEAHPEFRLQIGAEYMLDEHFLERLYKQPDEILRFGPARDLLLVELPTTVEPFNFDEFFDECTRQRIRPIIAHIERYAFIVGGHGPGKLVEWRQRGGLLQINLGSLVGQYGGAIRRASRSLWRDGFADILGTDMHRGKRAHEYLPRAWRYVRRRQGDFDPQTQQNLFAEST